MIKFLMMIYSQSVMMIRQIMFPNELYKSVKLDDDNCHPSLSKSDSENIHHKPRFSKI